jgi:hypothetical protein
MHDPTASGAPAGAPRAARRERRWLAAGQTGAVAGLVAGTVQPAVGWVIANTILPRGHDNNIAPRLVNRSVRRTTGHRSHPVLDWVGGTLFHYAYGAGWGAAYGVARRESRLPPLALGGIFAGLIYLLAFSQIGVGTRTGAEQEPDRRPWFKQASLLAVVLAYVVSLVVAYDRLAPRAARRRPRAG